MAALTLAGAAGPRSYAVKKIIISTRSICFCPQLASVPSKRERNMRVNSMPTRSSEYHSHLCASHCGDDQGDRSEIQQRAPRIPRMCQMQDDEYKQTSLVDPLTKQMVADELQEMLATGHDAANRDHGEEGNQI